MGDTEDKSEWVIVVPSHVDLDDEESGVLEKESIEIQTEPDGKLLLTSITAQFPGTTGLKFRNPGSGTLRGVRCQDNVLLPPTKDGWGSVKYICVNPAGDERKRKSDALSEGSGAKSAKKVEEESASKEEENIANDLIVLGLPFTTKEEAVRKYFEEFGVLNMCELKTRPNGASKGYAFIRFEERKVQNKVTLTRHMIEGRWCDVRVPNSQLKEKKPEEICKIFIARLSEQITQEDIRRHFEDFGEITDIFYADKPHRGFAFVTFVDSKVAQSLIGKEHHIKGTTVHIGLAAPKGKHENRGSYDEGRYDDRGVGKRSYEDNYASGSRGFSSRYSGSTPFSGSPWSTRNDY